MGGAGGIGQGVSRHAAAHGATVGVGNRESKSNVGRGVLEYIIDVEDPLKLQAGVYDYTYDHDLRKQSQYQLHHMQAE